MSEERIQSGDAPSTTADTTSMVNFGSTKNKSRGSKGPALAVLLVTLPG
jgi:hypothetical protein